jgi:hypothetical protein
VIAISRIRAELIAGTLAFLRRFSPAFGGAKVG